MSLIALALDPPITIHAAVGPPRDRTSRADRALADCKHAWMEAHELAKSKGQPAAKCARMAAVAYKLTMPKLDTLPAIRAYIACIAQGIQLEVFNGRDGSQLLYAAQVALSVLNQRRAKK